MKDLKSLLKLLGILALLIVGFTLPLTAQAGSTPSCTLSPPDSTGARVATCAVPPVVKTVIDTVTVPVAVHDTTTVTKTVVQTVTVHDTVRDTVLVAAPTPTTSTTPAAAIGATEPVFNAATQTMLVRDDMNYSTLAGAVAGGWRCTNGSTTQDTTTNPIGACQIVTGSSGAATDRALRLVYDGKANAAGQEGHAWSHTLGDALAGTVGHALYISYDFRVTPGGGFTLDDAGGGPHIVKVKWLELWTTTDRAQFSTAYQTCYNNVPQKSNVGGGTIWNFFANAGNNTFCQAGQVRPPFMYQGQGQWHRLTHKYVSRSSATANDGVAQLWYDGTLILSVKASDCGVTVPGAVNDAAVGYPSQPTTAENHYPAQWCQAKDLAGFFVNTPIVKLTFGSVSTSILWPFSIDYDHLTIWRD